MTIEEFEQASEIYRKYDEIEDIIERIKEAREEKAADPELIELIIDYFEKKKNHYKQQLSEIGGIDEH